ncbi:MAG: hypothetical protein N3A38_00805 [Planctomycetota bacterium]|nr:hypothetical protein [Planctomycetota bacterium]
MAVGWNFQKATPVAEPDRAAGGREEATAGYEAAPLKILSENLRRTAYTLSWAYCSAGSFGIGTEYASRYRQATERPRTEA